MTKQFEYLMTSKVLYASQTTRGEYYFIKCKPDAQDFDRPYQWRLMKCIRATENSRTFRSVAPGNNRAIDGKIYRLARGKFYGEIFGIQAAQVVEIKPKLTELQQLELNLFDPPVEEELKD